MSDHFVHAICNTLRTLEPLDEQIIFSLMITCKAFYNNDKIQEMWLLYKKFVCSLYRSITVRFGYSVTTFLNLRFMIAGNNCGIQIYDQFSPLGDGSIMAYRLPKPFEAADGTNPAFNLSYIVSGEEHFMKISISGRIMTIEFPEEENCYIRELTIYYRGKLDFGEV